MDAHRTVVHRYWQGTPPRFGVWTGKVLRHLGHDVENWRDETLPPECLAFADEHTWLCPGSLRHRANLVRLWLLATYGGWWADHDLIVLRPFDELPFPATASHRGTRCNCWMAFPPAHPVVLACISEIRARKEPGLSSREVSGEALLDRICPVLSPDVIAVPLALDPIGHREGEPWAIHLYAASTAV